MEKLFDEAFTGALWETCKYLGENIMGCKIVHPDLPIKPPTLAPVSYPNSDIE
ncbi:hypothetical protein D3C73_766560 [compost metagenome]